MVFKILKEMAIKTLDVFEEYNQVFGFEKAAAILLERGNQSVC